MIPLNFIKQEGIHPLPIQPLEIIQQNVFWLYTYEQFSEITGRDLEQICEIYGRDGFSMHISCQYFIIYNSARIKPRIKWTLMHELSHITLDHLENCKKCATNQSTCDLGEGSRKDPYDQEADRFTADVLAPIPLLLLCDVRDVKTLQRITGMSSQASNIRFQQLLHANVSMQQLQAYEQQFSDYIQYVSSDMFLADWNYDVETERWLRHKRKPSPKKEKKSRLVSCNLNRLLSTAIDEDMARLSDLYYSVE